MGADGSRLTIVRPGKGSMHPARIKTTGRETRLLRMVAHSFSDEDDSSRGARACADTVERECADADITSSRTFLGLLRGKLPTYIGCLTVSSHRNDAPGEL